jgi:tetratricopeptide (TPR) repeat protein
MVDSKIQNLFNKGFRALESGNLDYAIDLLFQCIELDPSFQQARKFLRAAEIKKASKKKSNSFLMQLEALTSKPAAMKVAKLIKTDKNQEAVLEAEKMLKKNVFNQTALNAFVDAAVAAKMPEEAVNALEMARDKFPEDIKIISRLGNLYQLAGRTTSAKECYERICEIAPNDPNALKDLKDAMAQDSLNTGGWERSKTSGDFRAAVKDKDQTAMLEKESKSVKSEDDLDLLIAQTLEKTKAEPDNINYLRALSRYYHQKLDFDNAIATLAKAQEKVKGDPELDDTLTKIKISKFQYEIKQLREAGKNEEADKLEVEKEQFIADDLQDKVQRYPNDMFLRFDLAIVYYKNDYINEAIQQLQLAQRNPKLRSQALYYLGMCFKKKEQYDMALKQLETAVAELFSMDDNKKNILYELGGIAELMGDKEKAAEYYKQIYSVDISYKDIAEKIDNLYKKS